MRRPAGALTLRRHAALPSTGLAADGVDRRDQSSSMTRLHAQTTIACRHPEKEGRRYGASRSVSDAAPRYTREQAAGRVYVCANRRPLSPCGAIDPR
jgi:hypothetical protein